MRLLHVGTRGCEQARELSLSGSLFLYRSLHAIIYHNHVWLDILLKLNCSHILWLQGHWVLAALFKVFINAFICSLTSADLFSPFFPLTSSRSFYKQIYLELELWQVCRLGRVILFKLLCSLRYQAWDHFFFFTLLELFVSQIHDFWLGEPRWSSKVTMMKCQKQCYGEAKSERCV